MYFVLFNFIPNPRDNYKTTQTHKQASKQINKYTMIPLRFV